MFHGRVTVFKWSGAILSACGGLTTVGIESGKCTYIGLFSANQQVSPVTFFHFSCIQRDTVAHKRITCETGQGNAGLCKSPCSGIRPVDLKKAGGNMRKTQPPSAACISSDLRSGRNGEGDPKGCARSFARSEVGCTLIREGTGRACQCRGTHAK